MPDSLIDDNLDFFNTIDSNGVVEIDGTLYRYDYCNQKVWVISDSDANDSLYNSDFMNGNERTDIVGSFPTYVDVIEAVNQGYKTMPDTNAVDGDEIFERGAEWITTYEVCYIKNDDYNNQVILDGKIGYEKFGFYFHFFAKEKYKKYILFNWFTSTGGNRAWSVDFTYYYHRKGSSSAQSGSGTVYPPSSGENKTAKTFYEGGRGLKNNSNYARWDVKNIYTDLFEVSRNPSGNPDYFRTLSGFTYVNNYTFDNGIYLHAISF